MPTVRRRLVRGEADRNSKANRAGHQAAAL